MAEITICSVFHSPESKKLLELNFDLVQKLNPGADFEWVVADNSPDQREFLVFSQTDNSSAPAAADYLHSRCENSDFVGNQAFRTCEGFSKTQGSLSLKIIPGIPHAPDNIPDWIKPSFHHNIAMNMSIPHIKNRFALFLDNDFYILQKDWIQKMVEYMQKNSLTFLGTPWHPKGYRVFRYFPCHQCLFVDLEKLREAGHQKEDLDFTPLEYEKAPQKPPEKKFGRLSRLLNIFNFKERRLIGQEKHTAHRIFEKFSGDAKIKFEIIPAVFKPERESYPAANLIYSLNKIFEFFLPDKWSYVPKDKSYYFTERFKKLGYCDVWGKGWEEYVWKGKPFGIHVRPIKQIKKGQTIDQIAAILKECFFSFSINL